MQVSRQLGQALGRMCVRAVLNAFCVVLRTVGMGLLFGSCLYRGYAHALLRSTFTSRECRDGGFVGDVGVVLVMDVLDGHGTVYVFMLPRCGAAFVCRGLQSWRHVVDRRATLALPVKLTT